MVIRMESEYSMIITGVVIAMIIIVSAGAFLHAGIRRFKKIRRYVESTPYWEKESDLARISRLYGFAYDKQKGYFYSLEEPWQKQYGYHRIYDELSGSMGMAVHCETIYFTYGGRDWMLGLWKGQYGLCTGGELGLYVRDEQHPGYYRCADTQDHIGMSMTLYRGKKELLDRRDWNWHVSGFCLGSCVRPEDLSMRITFRFSNAAMCQSFVAGLQAAGYDSGQYLADQETVYLHFGVPRTPQPERHRKLTKKMRMLRLRVLQCRYRFCIWGCGNLTDQLTALMYRAPGVFAMLNRIGNVRKYLREQARYH